MTGPMTGITATPLVQQTLPDQAAQVSKSGESKFDGVLADKAQATGKAEAVQSPDPVRQVESVGKSERPTMSMVSRVVIE